MKSLQSVLLMIVFQVTVAASSQLAGISLGELEAKSDLIALGEVTNIERIGKEDSVLVHVVSCLKGNYTTKYLKFAIRCRGGLNSFDRCLTRGDMGIFFLKGDPTVGKITLAYPGAYAMLTANHFLSKKIEIGP